MAETAMTKTTKIVEEVTVYHNDKEHEKVREMFAHPEWSIRTAGPITRNCRVVANRYKVVAYRTITAVKTARAKFKMPKDECRRCGQVRACCIC